MARDAAIEARLVGWAQWLQAGRRGEGYPSVSVLHRSWMPPAPGQVPSIKVATGVDHVHQVTHKAVKELSLRLSNTLVVHYLMRLPVAEQAARLHCQPSTVHARIDEAHRRISLALRGFYEL